ncbi:MAG TPA: MupA/Atu3671 family FMN-dependent luciferase-like monooxygenase [Candidatus Angelobacter sp.]|jgi:natural product biosynthesis luciferase-like monooxygenase protein|nr:MupA/Atu3671 family FMN-dependent luciferase-like monooxygenase [Candidatus Angelobacter sp.]
MEFGIMFFSSTEQVETGDPYYLLKEAARFADQHQFCCIWTPERHFHQFGGLFPNPSVLSAALATITERIQIRAGSLISPLHNTIRVAEDWAVVDNLSAGRVAISFGSGWNVDDFVLFPDHYGCRQQVMYGQIAMIQDLWRGKPLQQINPQGKEISVQIFPRPRQPELPVWITSSGNIETFRSAGLAGANLLTHLLGQDIASLAHKIAVYRQARGQTGLDPKTGIVSLMLHTYLGAELEWVKALVRLPFRQYLRSAVALEQKSAQNGGVISGGKEIEVEEISASAMEELLDLAFERYFSTAALLGTPSSCMDLVRELEETGVNEIACLLDFGLETSHILEGLKYLDNLRAACSGDALAEAVQQSVQEFNAEF